MKKFQVYFMPGLAASSQIFEHIALPQEHFVMHLLEWELPLDEETLTDYAARIAAKVAEPDPILIGVSFGGILVQEMAKFLHPKKIIIISSVKSNTEFPRRLRFAKRTGVHKLLPLGLFLNIHRIGKFPFRSIIGSRIQLYQKFLAMNDKRYLKWAIQQLVMWDRVKPDNDIIHIHGDSDQIFPIKYISGSVVVKGGTHIMVLNRFKWINENLPGIILEGKAPNNNAH